MLQAGFDVNAGHLGTPVTGQCTQSPRAAQVQSSFSQQVFDSSMNMPDMAVSERNIVFRRSAPGLQGMVMSRPPTGGFPVSNRSIIVGAGPDGIEYNTRLPTLFTQPSDFGMRKTTIMPAGPLTGGPDGTGETLYRVPDGKTRNAHGAMSTARAAQEAARGADRMAAARLAAYGLSPAMPKSSDAVQRAPQQSTPSSAIAASLASTPPQVPQAQNVPAGMMRFGAPIGPVAPPPGAGTGPMVSMWVGAETFWQNFWALVTQKLPIKEFNAQFLDNNTQQWTAVVFMAVALLALALIISVGVVKSKCKHGTCPARQ
jgi:hypothetical protein